MATGRLLEVFDALVCVFCSSLAVHDHTNASTLLWTIREPSWIRMSIRPVLSDSSTTRPNPAIESVQLRPSVLTFVHTELGTGEDLQHSKALPKPYAFQFIANTFNNSKFC